MSAVGLQFSAEQLDRVRARWDVVAGDLPLRRKGRELVGLCPFHGEKTPSFYVAPDKGFFHCFSGDTVVPTIAGRRRLGDLAGQATRLISPRSGWVPAFIDSFGHQPLYEVVLKRNGVERHLFTTAGHRWFVRGRRSVVLTSGLRPDMRLEAAMIPKRGNWSCDDVGIAHGIVFGDGSVQNGFGTVNLHDSKTELVRHFWPLGIGGGRRTRDAEHGYLRVYGGRLFDGFKALPSLAAADGYLLGFIAGWLATDGCVDDRDGAITLASSLKAPLEWLREAALKLGIETSAIRDYRRSGYLEKSTSLFSIEIRRRSIDASLLLRSEHRRRFAGARDVAFERKRWVVAEIRDAGRSEEVFCAQVTQENAFALDDDLLTGNCFGCGAHGTAIDYLMRRRGLDFVAAVRELLDLPPQRARLPAPRAPEPHDSKDGGLAPARRIWAEASPTDRRLVELYLWSRGLGGAAIPPTIRQHPSLYCAERDDKLPALVAALQDSRGQVTAVQRIWLQREYIVGGDRFPAGDPRGSRIPDAPKKTRGVMGDGCVRLAPVDDGTLGLAEGVETAFAAMLLYRVPVWATCGVHRLGFPAHWCEVGVPDGQRPDLWIDPMAPPTATPARRVRERPPAVWIPNQVRRLLVFGDNGDTGEIVAEFAAAWWRRTRGIEAVAVLPDPQHGDFNEQLLARSRKAAA